MPQWPTRFRGTFDNRIYILTYAHGGSDVVIGVRVRDANDEPGRPVIEIGYPYSHGSGLRVGTIHHETEDEITFEVEEPQTNDLNGVVNLRRTDRLWTDDA